MIGGKQTRLRAAERADLPRFVAWLNDPDVTAGLLIHQPISMVQEEDWFERNRQKAAELQTLVIEHLEHERWLPVGTCGFHSLAWKDRVAEVGILIGEKQWWGRGIGTEAMRLMLRYGFRDLNLNRIALQVFANNARAIRSYEKTGFVLEGRMRQDVYKNGQYLDVIVMGILRSEWQDIDV